MGHRGGSQGYPGSSIGRGIRRYTKITKGLPEHDLLTISRLEFLLVALSGPPVAWQVIDMPAPAARRVRSRWRRILAYFRRTR
jgi:hypothetical protein